MRRIARILNNGQPDALLAIRTIVGGLFVYHGIDKFDTGISMVEGAFSSWGVPAAGLTAPATAVIEIVAGLALIVGLGTRVAGAVLGLVMLGAILYVKADLGLISSEPMPGAELDLAYLSGLVALIAFGPGRLSADAILGLESATVAASTSLGVSDKALAGSH